MNKCLTNVRFWVLFLVLSSTDLATGASDDTTAENSSDKENKEKKLLVFPTSGLLDDERAKAIKHLEEINADYAKTKKEANCPSLKTVAKAKLPETRNCLAQAIYKTRKYKNLVADFNVDMKSEMIGNVNTEVFTPKSGIAPGNRNRVLINLHAGDMLDGVRTLGRMESIPIADLAKIKVISVDYRLAPEHRYPAASEDVAAVYRALLEHYKPENIGIYGCAEGRLIAQSIAWLIKEDLPLPAATGMLCDGVAKLDGDAMHIASAVSGTNVFDEIEFYFTGDNTYFQGVDMNDPMITPAESDELLSKFPPSLLVSSTRSPFLSAIVHSHSELTRVGAEADLHIWEGLNYGFFLHHYLPQSRELYNVVIRFFDKHLGH